MESDPNRCVFSDTCGRTLHAHLIGLPRDEQTQFLRNLTGRQRSELASTISTLPPCTKYERAIHTAPCNPRDVRVGAGADSNIFRASELLNRTNKRRKEPVYTFSKATRYAPLERSRKPGDEVDKWISSLRFGAPRNGLFNSAPSLLGPGSYPLDCDLPLDDFDIPAEVTTRSRHILMHELDHEERIGRDGALKGLSGMWGPRNSNPGIAAGSYKTIDIRHLSKSTIAPCYSIPKDSTGRGRVELMTRVGREM